jgi:Raf kinase inhibitor-like YbhB/YbcL family protein
MRGLYKTDYKEAVPAVSRHSDSFFRKAYELGCTFPVMYIRWFMPAAVILSALVILGGCTSTTSSSIPQSTPGTPQPVQSDQQPVQLAVPSGMLILSVASLSPGSVLPDVYTCKGASKSPEVSWSNIPAGAKSLVLILDDPDAPAGTFTHWLVYNIPPGSGDLAQGQPYVKVLANDAQQGESSTGSRGYFPPCPPIGSQHRYIFHLYAADINLALPTADRAAIDQALNGHILAKTEFTTTFKR